MKKTVFAAQVFGLIAMLPMVVILEMNHVPLHGKTPSGMVNTTSNTITTLPQTSSYKSSGEVLSVSMETFLFTTAW